MTEGNIREERAWKILGIIQTIFVLVLGLVWNSVNASLNDMRAEIARLQDKVAKAERLAVDVEGRSGGFLEQEQEFLLRIHHDLMTVYTTAKEGPAEKWRQQIARDIPKSANSELPNGKKR